MALERSYNKLTEVQRETLNNLHEGVAVFGGDGRLRLSNPEFARLWNLAPEDLADRPHVAELIEKTRPLFPAAGN
jgi:PAS domain-containing protein